MKRRRKRVRSVVKRLVAPLEIALHPASSQPAPSFIDDEGKRRWFAETIEPLWLPFVGKRVRLTGFRTRP